MSYSFTRTNPPLLKDELDIRGIPPSSLEEFCGKTGLTTTTDNIVFGDVIGSSKIIRRITKVVNLDRMLRWVIAGPAEHYAADLTRSVTIRKGYTRTEREAFERTTGLEVKAGYGIVDANVKLGLKMTSSTDQTWTEDDSRTETQKLDANTTYVNWWLLDVVTADVVSTENLFFDDKPVSGEVSPVQSRTVIAVVLFSFQDKVLDLKRETFRDIGIFKRVSGGWVSSG